MNDTAENARTEGKWRVSDFIWREKRTWGSEERAEHLVRKEKTAAGCSRGPGTHSKFEFSQIELHLGAWQFRLWCMLCSPKEHFPMCLILLVRTPLPPHAVKRYSHFPFPWDTQRCGGPCGGTCTPHPPSSALSECSASAKSDLFLLPFCPQHQWKNLIWLSWRPATDFRVAVY